MEWRPALFPPVFLEFQKGEQVWWKRTVASCGELERVVAPKPHLKHWGEWKEKFEFGPHLLQQWAKPLLWSWAPISDHARFRRAVTWVDASFYMWCLVSVPASRPWNWANKLNVLIYSSHCLHWPKPICFRSWTHNKGCIHITQCW